MRARSALFVIRSASRAVCVVLVLSIAGCGGGGGGGRADPTPALAPTPTDMPTVVPTTMPMAAPAVVGGPIAMRRLTAAQFRASIADIFGEDIVVAGRTELDNRRSGLLAVGSSFVSVTGAGFEQYDAIARQVAEQALDPAHRDGLVPCAPEATTKPDDDCAARFIRAVGGRLLRRPLVDDEVASRVALARDAAAALADFYTGLEAPLTALLLSPEFLFRVEVAEPDPDDPRRQRLTGASMASRLSYLLWNTTPDDELLAAAERGELVDATGLASQVDRLLASDRLADAARAFFSDWYGFDEIEEGLVRKDPALFPAFSQALINDAREQTLRVINDHLLDRDRDYRDLFTTRQSFMTRALGVVYQVPVRTPMGWEPFVFPPGSERAGLLTHVSLLALRSHPGRSSPTLRGKFVREVLLCTHVPPPPGDIDFSEFAKEGGDNRRTARDRLAVHQASEVCAGCHALMDPIGLGLEKLDGIGMFRETENGADIDPSGELNGVPFANAVELGEVLSRDAGLGPCFVESLYKYAVGRDVVAGEREWLDEVSARLADSGYHLRDLLRIIATSDAFRTTSGPRIAEETPLTPSPGETAMSSPTIRSTDGPAPTATPTGGQPGPTRTPSAETEPTPRGPTFSEIQDQIFTPRCATQYCHSQQARSGGLVLEAGVAFANLVGVRPTNAAADAAGMRRVDPFAPANSFLILKISQPSSGSFGSRMPLVGPPLSEEEIASIRDWILAGAQP